MIQFSIALLFELLSQVKDETWKLCLTVRTSKNSNPKALTVRELTNQN